jgi:AmmeMemoRadiSam system protein B
MTTISPKGVRPPAVAGRFYPSDAVELRELIHSFLDSAPAPSGPAPKAIIVPHAGYIYSGPIAATAYARLRPGREVIKRVVLLGPAHFVAFRGLATTSANGFGTPLGVVPVNAEAVRKLAEFPQVTVLDAAHAPEHSLEVQLPFLQAVLGDFSVVPLVVGEAEVDEVRPVLDAVWGGPETCFVISSDLSHYHDAETARQLDRLTAIAIEAMKPESIVEDGACGRIPVCGLLRAAAAHRLSAKTLDLRNSGDTGGPRDRVVGYGAFAFEERCHE